MRNAPFLLFSSLSLLACQPASDRSDTQEVIAESGVTGAGADRGDGDPVAEGAELATPETLPANAVVEPSAPANSADTINEADDSGSEASGPQSDLAIPAQYRGRWGMVPADCKPGRSDAKGLLTIGDQTLRFYESVGALQEQRPAIATSFAGVYSFTGEGQTWERVVVLARDDNELTRTEGGRSYTYTRCT